MADIEQRAQFEAWADSEGLVLHRYGNGKYGYERAGTATAWQAWQAALASQAQVPEGFVLVPREPTQEMFKAASELVAYPGLREQWNAMIAAAPAPEVR